MTRGGIFLLTQVCILSLPSVSTGSFSLFSLSILSIYILALCSLPPCPSAPYDVLGVRPAGDFEGSPRRSEDDVFNVIQARVLQRVLLPHVHRLALRAVGLHRRGRGGAVGGDGHLERAVRLGAEMTAGRGGEWQICGKRIVCRILPMSDSAKFGL